MLNTITRQLASKIRIHRNITIHRTYSDFIKYDRIKNIGSVILNRPKQLNAFTGDMAESLISKLKEFECDDKVKAVVIKSNDNRAFCCGGDIKRLHHLISQENWDVLFKSQGTFLLNKNAQKSIFLYKEHKYRLFYVEEGYFIIKMKIVLISLFFINMFFIH